MSRENKHTIKYAISAHKFKLDQSYEKKKTIMMNKAPIKLDWDLPNKCYNRNNRTTRVIRL